MDNETIELKLQKYEFDLILIALDAYTDGVPEGLNPNDPDDKEWMANLFASDELTDKLKSI